MTTTAADSEYKIVLLGDPGVGKTTWFTQVRQGEFVDTDNAAFSIGVDHLEHRVVVDGKEVKVRELHLNPCFSNSYPEPVIQVYLHDTGGGERFRTLTANFYRHADAAILMYSVEDRYTFENLQEWVESAADVVDMDSFMFALVGNKSDLPLEVEHESIKARCDTLGTQLSFFTSAKTGENVAESFKKIVQHLHRTSSTRSAAPTVTGTIIRPTGVGKTQKQSCCLLM